MAEAPASSSSASWVPGWLKPWPEPRQAPTGGLREVATGTDNAEAGPSRLADVGEPEELATPAYLLDEYEEQRKHSAGPTLGIPVTGAALGFAAGFYQSARRAGLVFMAENAHRRPDTVQGWYFYNKTKNYRVMFAAMKGGARTAVGMGLWTLVFVTLELGFNRVRRGEDVWRELRVRGILPPAKTDRAVDAGARTDEIVHAGAPLGGQWIDGAGAGLSIAIGASLLYRLPSPVTRRALVFGTGMGAAAGGMRDAHALLLHKKLEHEASVAQAATASDSVSGAPAPVTA